MANLVRNQTCLIGIQRPFICSVCGAMASPMWPHQDLEDLHDDFFFYFRNNFHHVMKENSQLLQLFILAEARKKCSRIRKKCNERCTSPECISIAYATYCWGSVSPMWQVKDQKAHEQGKNRTDHYSVICARKLVLKLYTCVSFVESLGVGQLVLNINLRSTTWFRSRHYKKLYNLWRINFLTDR